MSGEQPAPASADPGPVVPGSADPGSADPGSAAARRSSGSLLPGAILVASLIAGAVFGAGYSLGGSGLGLGQDAEAHAAIEAFGEAYDRIRADFVGEVDADALLGAAIGAMFETLGDPYSSYMSADDFDSDLADISGEFEGIGARMAGEDAVGDACEPLGDSCRLLVIEVIADSPAAEGGLRGGDEVRAIDAHPVAGLTLDDAVTLIRGPSGRQVELTVERDGTERRLTITRDVIRAQDVRSEVLADGRVGYLRIDTFSADAADEFREALRAHVDAGIRDIVIDVRDDPGGFVDGAVSVASEFLADGAVFREEHAGGDERVIEARRGGVATDPGIEVAVLIDDRTASASEILAGALQGRGRATLIGEATFGKGSIQEWTALPGDSGGFRLSVARWLLPDGSSVERVGLQPDVPVRGSPGIVTTGDPVAALESDPVVRAAIDVLAGGAAGEGATGERRPEGSPRPSASAIQWPSSGAPRRARSRRHAGAPVAGRDPVATRAARG